MPLPDVAAHFHARGAAALRQRARQRLATMPDAIDNCQVAGLRGSSLRFLSTFPSEATKPEVPRQLPGCAALYYVSFIQPVVAGLRGSSLRFPRFVAKQQSLRYPGKPVVYHARMARRAQHLRCSLREANERTTSWINLLSARLFLLLAKAKVCCAARDGPYCAHGLPSSAKRPEGRPGNCNVFA